MTTKTKMPDEIFVAGRNAYKGNDVFSSNYEGALLAKDAWECTSYTRTEILESIRAENAALRAGVPEGWQLVPKEPTMLMDAAGVANYNLGNGVLAIYEAMLSSSPVPPVAGMSRPEEILLNVVKFYARKDHWMATTEDGVETLLIARGQSIFPEGWAEAHGALQAYAIAKAAPTQADGTGV